MQQSSPNFTTGYRIAISRCDRWQVYQRLQELEIECACLTDGSLQVNISTPVEILQIQSVARQFTSNRQYLIKWLEWQYRQ